MLHRTDAAWSRLIDTFSPVMLGPISLRNRIIKAATFEGMCPGGVPSEDLIAHHRRIAAGGAGLTTVAYCAVSADGRSYPTQPWMRPAILPPFRKLTEAVHAEGGAASVQIGHCGYFANKKVIGGRPLAPSVRFNLYGLARSRAMTEDDMERVAHDFEETAALAIEAGFDAVEIHLGHGYLLSQFLSPYTNRRRDAYGGSLSNRLRFPVEVVRRVRARVKDRAVLVKMNLTDGFEGVEVAKALEVEGVDALVLSGGFVSRTPLYMLRGDVPLREMVAVQDSWFRRIGLRLFGRFFVQTYPFDEMFFREPAERVRDAVSLPLVLLGGIRSQAHINTARSRGFDFIGMGRPLLHDPDLVRKMAAGQAEESGCRPCNLCIVEMDRGGVRCVQPSPSLLPPAPSAE
jgi:2,4-dienoyl-CoA reductase-like NADH-dependent reductase (Old Yellow Enzyme family)